MAYYPDLSQYQYGAARDGAEPDLNVGWLSHDHPYPIRSPEGRFVDALLRCCLRPARLYRGYHTCDLGCEQSDDYEMLALDYDGRKIMLGNGEVRVRGPDGQYYAAPTLVAHYVAVHRYAPPAPFVDGVLQRSRDIYVLHGAALSRIGMLAVVERFALCLDALRMLHAQTANNRLAEAISALDAARPALDPQLFMSYRAELGQMDRAVLGSSAAEEPITAVARPLSQFFVWVRYGEDKAREVTLQLTASVLELAHEVGLKHWRSDMKPTRADEAP